MGFIKRSIGEITRVLNVKNGKYEDPKTKLEAKKEEDANATESSVELTDEENESIKVEK